MLNNYLSKISLAVKLSADLKTFFILLINSKRYSSALKRQQIAKNHINKIAKYNFRFKQLQCPVIMRTFSGDIDIFYEIFWKEVYKIPNKLTAPFKTIVDLGAHIGLTSIYYSQQYPKAQIIAVEGATRNYELLKKNVQHIPNIIHYNAAIYPVDGFVKFNQEGLSYNAKISTYGQQTLALSVTTLMKNNHIDRICLLKIDIEGAEELLLKEGNDWLDKVDNIIIEIHGRYRIEDLKKDLIPYGFKLYPPVEIYPELKNIFATKHCL